MKLKNAMDIPNTVRKYLASQPGQYKVRAAEPAATFEGTVAAAGVPAEKVARAYLLKTGSSYLMAIVPASREPDLELLGRMFKREFEVCGEEEIAERFADCDPQMIPPLAGAYGLKAIQDRTLNEQDHIYFASGRAGVFIRASHEEFGRLQAASSRLQVISRALPAPADDETRDLIRSRVESVGQLPAMPGMAAEIIRLRNNPYSHASELSAVIEQDPSLSAQLVRYAASPLYGYQGKVESVEQAIVRVLGMDFVYEFAFGLALGKSFRNPKDGPIGLNAFWEHAIHSAALTQALCNAIEFSRRPSPGTAYLAGLLHNFGFLLLGHLFPEQFERLNRLLAEEPDRPILELERYAIGVTHTELGLWLMDAWDMPKAIVETVREHHNPGHCSDFSEFANLVYVANALLKRHGIGDSETVDFPDPLLERIGLDRVQAEVALATVMEGSEGLEFIARKMAA